MLAALTVYVAVMCCYVVFGLSRSRIWSLFRSYMYRSNGCIRRAAQLCYFAQSESVKTEFNLGCIFFFNFKYRGRLILKTELGTDTTF